MYLRLAPAVIFVALLGGALLLWKVNFNIFLLMDSKYGLNLRDKAPVFYVVIWYVSSYFWWGLLIYWLLKNFETKKLLPFFAMAAYVCLFAAYQEYPMAMKYTYRAFSALGLGVITGYMSPHISFAKGRAWRVLFTLVEIGAFCYIVRAGRAEIWNYVAAMIMLLLVAHNAGFFSSWLNRQKWITFFSKYAYSMYVAQGLAVIGLKKYALGAPPYSPSAYAWVILTDIVLAVIIYHLVEKRFIKKEMQSQKG